jgi:hypothetical protein
LFNKIWKSHLFNQKASSSIIFLLFTSFRHVETAHWLLFLNPRLVHIVWFNSISIYIVRVLNPAILLSLPFFIALLQQCSFNSSTIVKYLHSMESSQWKVASLTNDLLGKWFLIMMMMRTIHTYKFLKVYKSIPVDNKAGPPSS